MTPGYLYVMTNPSFRADLVKIGVTRRHPAIRAEELFETGVPTPFEVYYCVRVADIWSAETTMHNSYAKRHRVDERREFFNRWPPLVKLKIWWYIATGRI